LRYFIKFSYKGTNYHGWQYQPNARSVQETLSKALSVVMESNEEIVLMGAGRTDTGVHAREMFAHFDFEEPIGSKSCIHKLNSYLPIDIVVCDIVPVHYEAHARFDAVKRTYEHHITTFKNPFKENLSWYYNKDLEGDLMNEASKLLLIHYDFQAFSKVNTDVNTFLCKISEEYWTKEGSNLIFTITADRCLSNMVRALVGTLITVSLPNISFNDLKPQIENKKTRKAGK